jgi:hypothetical protein
MKQNMITLSLFLAGAQAAIGPGPQPVLGSRVGQENYLYVWGSDALVVDDDAGK